MTRTKWRYVEFKPLIGHEDASGRLAAVAVPPSIACHCATYSIYVRLIQKLIKEGEKNDNEELFLCVSKKINKDEIL